MFWLFGVTHWSDIGRLYWEKPLRHSPCRIIRVSINGVSTIFSFTSWVIYVPIGCRHPFMKYWQPLLAKTIAIWSLLHPENERQRSVDSFSCCIFGNQGIAQILPLITELLTSLLSQNIFYQSENTHSKLIDIANCEACNKILSVVENTILMRYY